MKLQEFLRLGDRDLPNELIVEKLVVPGKLSVGDLELGQPFREVRQWPLAWEDDAEDGSRARVSSDPGDYIRAQSLMVSRDADGLIRYVEWTLNFNAPPGEPRFLAPGALIAAAFEKSLGPPKKATKAGKKWVSGDSTLLIAEGADSRSESFQGFTVIGMLHEPFRSQALLDRALKKL